MGSDYKHDVPACDMLMIRSMWRNSFVIFLESSRKGRSYLKENGHSILRENCKRSISS